VVVIASTTVGVELNAPMTIPARGGGGPERARDDRARDRDGGDFLRTPAVDLKR
jgi:hypothetical protein